MFRSKIAKIALWALIIGGVLKIPYEPLIRDHALSFFNNTYLGQRLVVLLQSVGLYDRYKNVKILRKEICARSLSVNERYSRCDDRGGDRLLG